MDQSYRITVVLLISILHCVNSNKVRWCTISDKETTKCWDMVDALNREGVSPEMECVDGVNAAECMDMIKRGEAHLITLDGGDVYHAGSSFDMQVIMGEQYDYGEFYYAVAVVHKDNAAWTFRDLKNKKSCHTGIRKTSGWNVPIGYMINEGIIDVQDCQGDIVAAGNFFSQSCAPGTLNTAYNPFGDNPTSLCDLCVGSGANNCVRNSHEPYYNYAGAFRCLVENAGQVAFVKHTTVQDVLDSAEDWASGVSESNFRLLCKDGTSKSVDQYEECNLAKVPSHAVMTSGTATPDEITTYKQLLNTAQNKFKADDGSNFKMFDSSSYDGKDLMFKDSTTSLYNVDGGSYTDYLGQDYVDTVEGLHKCSENSIRWCTVGTNETKKCRAMKEAFAGASLSKVISCYQADDHVDCMGLIKDGSADLMTLDGGDVYKAGKDYGLVPVAGEKYSEDLEGTSYYAVAVVKKTSDFTINDLKGKKSCHTGIKKTSGWNMPVGYLIEQGHITPDPNKCDVVKKVGDFFSKSCVPGAKSSKYDPDGDNPSSLCELCKGAGNNKCARSSVEPYYGYAGAFRCLAEDKGEVAFVKHTTVSENTAGANSQQWAVHLQASDYELLCKDGSRKPVSDWRNCNLARVPSHAVMTNKDNDRDMLWNFLNEAQGQFGSSSTGFKMFDSQAANYTGSNLLFKDSTLELVDAGNKDTYRKWLGDEYYNAVEALECKLTSSSGKVFLSPLLFIMMAVIKYFFN